MIKTRIAIIIVTAVALIANKICSLHVHVFSKFSKYYKQIIQNKHYLHNKTLFSEEKDMQRGVSPWLSAPYLRGGYVVTTHSYVTLLQPYSGTCVIPYLVDNRCYFCIHCHPAMAQHTQSQPWWRNILPPPTS